MDYGLLLTQMRRFNDNMVDVLAAQRGWPPLEINEEMTITIWIGTQNKRYFIKRIADDPDEEEEDE
jgi:hypothetical protein